MSNRGILHAFGVIFIGLFWLIAFSFANAADFDPDILTTDEQKWLQNHANKLAVAPEENYPPFTFFEGDVWQGMSADFIQEVEEKIGTSFSILAPRNLDTILESFRNGESAIVTSIKQTQERSQYLCFTQPYVSVPTIIIVKADSNANSWPESFIGKRVAVGKGYGVQMYLERNFPNIDLSLVSNDLKALHKLSFGEVDAVIMDIASASYLIDIEKITNLRVFEKFDYNYDLSFGVHKDFSVLCNILSKALSAIPEHKKQLIFNKWVKIEADPFSILWVKYKQLSPIFLGFIGIFIALGITSWNISLRGLVAKKTEELQASHDLFAKLAHNIPGVVYQYQLFSDGRSCFPYASEGIYDIYGVTPEQVRTDSSLVFDNLHPDDYDRVVASIQESANTMQPWKLEYRVKLPNKGIRWLFGSSKPEKLTDGSTLWHGFITDITDRKLADMEREHLLNLISLNESRLQEILNLMPLVLFVKDAFSNITLMNRSCEEQWGIAFSAVHGTNGSQFFPPEQMTQFITKDKAVFENPQQIDLEEDVWNATLKENRTVHTYKKPVFDKNGKPQYLIGISIDITERKRMEAALRESEAKLRGLYELSPLGIALTDMQGHYIEFNESFRKMCGYSAEEMKQLDYWALTPRKYETEEARQLRLLSETGRYGPYEKEYIRKDGTSIPLRLNGVMITGLHGENLIWSIVEDISESRLIEQSLQHAKELAETASRAKSAFLANMSHEIRTPMNAIIGLTGVLLKRNDLNPTQRHNLTTIATSADHLLNIINDILDISKIESGKLTLAPVEFSLSELIDSLSILLNESLLAKGLSLTIDIDHLPDLLRGDAMRLKQMLLNYLSNAIKFTEQGCIRLRASILEESEDACLLRFEVEDTGVGLNEEEQLRLFNAFEQADSTMTRRYGGTGLGLAITRHFAQLMGGQTGVKSEPSKGSLFWFSVRLEKVAPKLPIQTQMNVVALPEAHNLQDYAGARLLIAEDDAFNRMVVMQQLGDTGLLLEYAENGQIAVEMAQSQHYDLILMDMQMPKMGGIEATRLIRQLQGYQSTPIIAMTANAFAEDRQACIDAGMNEHLAKPVVFNDLTNTLLRWLGNVEQKTALILQE